MKQFLVIAVILISQCLQAQQVVFHDANIELRAVGEYHAISVSGGIDLYLSQGQEDSVAVSGSTAAERENIVTDVVDGVLQIGVKKHNWIWANVNSHLKAYVSFKKISSLTASGASDVSVYGFIEGDKLDIELTGASDFKGAVRVDSLSIRQRGASDARISGTVNGLTSVVLSGASEMKGYELTTDQCEAHASGASDIRITVNNEMNASASGASSVFYKGDAVLKQAHASGSSTVSKR